MHETLYSTARWRRTRARILRRDADRCTVARLLGGACGDGPLHVHHIRRPLSSAEFYDEDNLASVCHVHHPRWEALRRYLDRLRAEPGRESERHECDLCALTFKTSAGLADHRSNVHREGWPEPDWDLNRAMIRQLRERLTA